MTGSADKLKACLNYDFVDTDKDLPVEYLAACRRWVDALSEKDRVVATVARATLDTGNETEAEKIAAVLPTAPAFPL